MSPEDVQSNEDDHQSLNSSSITTESENSNALDQDEVSSTKSLQSDDDEKFPFTKSDDPLLAEYVRKKAMENIEKKRKLYIDYKKEQKGRMISFLTSILTDPVAPIFNQVLKQYLKPINFSIFEGIEAEKVKNLISSEEEIEKLRKSIEGIPSNIFNEEKRRNLDTTGQDFSQMPAITKEDESR
ncbi:hypothetical protein C9374_008741 [Naegleria lovaniensis]|uniref:Uncharacterized protein n=1 Tax=Naegleria lovaniensis TaxID=51637 RepID=A0AA88KKS2_NAELO|nr:uncharacterized protein C9374_008741 [Naegleria lovaniensis]KAG2378119.1 hypothetical protein C9374_008741 [Naegleria lovaniensis]